MRQDFSPNDFEVYGVYHVNKESIIIGNFVEAYILCGDIDEKDTPFVALTLELEGEP